MKPTWFEGSVYRNVFYRDSGYDASAYRELEQQLLKSLDTPPIAPVQKYAPIIDTAPRNDVLPNKSWFDQAIFTNPNNPKR